MAQKCSRACLGAVATNYLRKISVRHPWRSILPRPQADYMRPDYFSPWIGQSQRTVVMLRVEGKLKVSFYTKHAAAEEGAGTGQRLKIGLRKAQVTMFQRWSLNGTVKRADEGRSVSE